MITNRMNKHPGQSGFTLLELLTAMAMMVVLAASLYSGLYIGFRSKRSAEAAVGPVRKVQIVLKLLQRDIEAAQSPTGILAGPFVGVSAAGARGYDSDTLVFFTNHYQPYSGASGYDLVQVEFFIESSSERMSHFLVRRTTTNLLASMTPETFDEILCREIISLNLRYFDGYEWLDDWDSTTVGDILPEAVEITLGLDNSEYDMTSEEKTYFVVHAFLLPCHREAEGEEMGPGGAR